MESGPPKAEARAVTQESIPLVIDSVQGNYYIRNIDGPRVAIARDAGYCWNREICLSSDIGHGVGFAELSRSSIEFRMQVYLCTLLYVPMKHTGRNISDTVRCCDDDTVAVLWSSTVDLIIVANISHETLFTFFLTAGPWNFARHCCTSVFPPVSSLLN